MITNSKRLEFRVGLISTVAIVILVVGILWGKRAAFGLEQQEILVAFDNAAGISSSTPVFLHGVKVGSVSDVKATDIDARVTLRIDKDVELYSDAQAFIRVMELTGGKKIELIPGEPGTSKPVMPLPGKNEGDIGELIASAQNLTQYVGPVLRRADSVLASIGDILDDPKLRRDIGTTLDQFARTGEQLNSFLHTNSPRVERTLVAVEELSADLRDLMNRSEPGIDNLLTSTNALTADATTTLADARRLINKLDAISVKIDAMATDIRDGNGTISRMIYDDNFAKELQVTIQKLKELLILFSTDGVNVNMEIGHER